MKKFRTFVGLNLEKQSTKSHSNWVKIPARKFLMPEMDGEPEPRRHCDREMLPGIIFIFLLLETDLIFGIQKI